MAETRIKDKHRRQGCVFCVVVVEPGSCMKLLIFSFSFIVQILSLLRFGVFDNQRVFVQGTMMEKYWKLTLLITISTLLGFHRELISI
jgi:hypothetical protein